ncbi:hypothetical protein [Streptosporangium saharense]|uniref:Uncharacterized protein n=1 Tax=Streptosporangium saharense TaxID=1706840 RepID=A0A7W7QPL5_9ACTN|nr:hypothetical protein [Streptosporangium saharense]MBB4917439.1 hypothetical protein [Streptosporangium saharense]
MTVSNQASVGQQHTWDLVLPDGIRLPVCDTTWAGGERDIVLGVPAGLPELPRELALLLGKRRASVECVADRSMLYMSVYLVMPDAAGWPRFKKKLDFGELFDTCGEELIYGLKEHGVHEIGTKGEALGETGRSRNELCALFASDWEAAPVATRVVPTLRLSGVLAL